MSTVNLILIGGFADSVPVISGGPIQRRLQPYLADQPWANRCQLRYFTHRQFEAARQFAGREQTPTILIAHSYGCDSFFSGISPTLAQARFPLHLLVTLDPVGKRRPRPLLEPAGNRPVMHQWVNVRASSAVPDRSDMTASLARLRGGGKWPDCEGADNLEFSGHHADTIGMVNCPGPDGRSVMARISEVIARA